MKYKPWGEGTENSGRTRGAPDESTNERTQPPTHGLSCPRGTIEGRRARPICRLGSLIRKLLVATKALLGQLIQLQLQWEPRAQATVPQPACVAFREDIALTEARR